MITGVSGGSFTALAYALYGERLFAEYEAAVPQARRARARCSAQPEPVQLVEVHRRQRRALGARRRLLRRDPVRGRDVRRPARQARAGRDRDRDRHLDRLAPRVLPERLRPALLGPEQGSPVARGGHVLGGPGRAVGGDVQQLRRHLRLSVSGLGERRRRTRRPAPGRRHARCSATARCRHFQNSKDRPYIHLVDGGVADNIGVRGVLEALEELEASAAFRDEVGFGVVRRIVLIVVNARSAPRTDWDRNESPPGFVAQLLQSSGVPIDRYSFETVELMKDRAEICDVAARAAVARARLAGATEAQAEASVPKLDLQVLDVSFDAIPRPEGARLLHEPAHELRAPGRGSRPAARGRRPAAAPVAGVRGDRARARRPAREVIRWWREHPTLRRRETHVNGPQTRRSRRPVLAGSGRTFPRGAAPSRPRRGRRAACARRPTGPRRARMAPSGTSGGCPIPVRRALLRLGLLR